MPNSRGQVQVQRQSGPPPTGKMIPQEFRSNPSAERIQEGLDWGQRVSYLAILRKKEQNPDTCRNQHSLNSLHQEHFLSCSELLRLNERVEQPLLQGHTGNPQFAQQMAKK